MQIIRGNPARLSQFPIDGAGSDIVEGAVMMPGVTAATNLGLAIQASGAAADAIGILGSLHDFSVDGDSNQQNSDSYVRRGIAVFEPGCEVAAELANTTSDDIDVASATATVITITSMEDDMYGGWIYVSSGTGIGQLQYITAASTSNITVDTMTTTLDNTSKLIMLRPLSHQLVSLNSAADKLTSANTAGSLPWRVLRHQFKVDGDEVWRDLDPGNDSGKQLNSINPTFQLILSPADTLKNPLD